MPAPRPPPLRDRRHGIPARDDVLADPLRRAARERRRGAGHRRAGRRSRSSAAPGPDGGRGRRQGLSRGASGSGDLLEALGRAADAAVRHPGGGHGLRLWRPGLLQRDRAVDLPRDDRQVVALHRLGAPPARRGPDRLCARRRHSPSRRLQGPVEAPRRDRAPVLARRRDEGADLDRDLRTASRAGLGAVQGRAPASRATLRC